VVRLKASIAAAARPNIVRTFIDAFSGEVNESLTEPGA
jgi:hypothetical protein